MYLFLKFKVNLICQHYNRVFTIVIMRKDSRLLSDLHESESFFSKCDRNMTIYNFGTKFSLIEFIRACCKWLFNDRFENKINLEYIL